MGVQFTGAIRHDGPQDEKAVMLGAFEGDVEWKGVLVLPRSGKLIVESFMRCREMIIGGAIVGANEGVVIENGLLQLVETASIDVATISVPPGGLEQPRGAVVKAKLRMSKENLYATEATGADKVPRTPAVPRLLLPSATPATIGVPAGENTPLELQESRPPSEAGNVAFGAR